MMEAKSKISFGFKKAIPGIGGTKPIASGSSSTSRSFFDDQEDGDFSNPSTSATPQKEKKKVAITSISGAAPLSRSAKARTEDALSVDASIFDYDGVYDSMKVGERQAAQQREEEKKKRDPKYISAFLASSEQRKLDRSRAEAKMIQREREAEGEEYAGTEAFVTDAYKEQMEEIKVAEEREKKKEEENRSKSKGVAGFYKSFMEDRDKEHQAAVAASLQVSAPSIATIEVESDPSDDAEKQRAIQEARLTGKDVRVNDDNEVVDERSLLSAGLNTFGKKKKADDSGVSLNGVDRYGSDSRTFPRDGAREARGAREAQRQRQSKMIEEQMLELEKKKEEAARREEEQKKAALIQERRNDSNSVASAKERALERKRKREEEEAQRKREKGGETKS